MNYPKYPVWQKYPNPQENSIDRMEELKKVTLTFYWKLLANHFHRFAKKK